jgi:capsular exopolysaccharide synthesis family protein
VESLGTLQIVVTIGTVAALLSFVGVAVRRRRADGDMTLIARPANPATGGAAPPPAVSDGEPPVTLIEDRRAPASEAFRVLRTRLLIMANEGKLRHVLITSSGPGEGKTMTAANLAVAIAQAGRKVLLVDADLARPRLRTAFQLDNDPGLSQLLREDGAVTEDVLSRFCQATRVANLSFLAAGSPADGAAELFAGARMRAVVSAFGAAYDLVVYDSPPVLSVADPTVLAGVVDGVLLVVRVGMYPSDAIQQANRELTAVHAKLIGVVLNGVEAGSRGGYYGHYRYAYHD